MVGLAVTQSHILFDLAPRRLALASAHPCASGAFVALSMGRSKRSTKARFESYVLWFVKILPMVGLEPTQSCPRWILNPLRLPVSPHRRFDCGSKDQSSTSMYLPLPRATIFPISFSISALFSITFLFFFTNHPRR